MALGMSNVHEQECLDHILNIAAYTQTPVFLALLTGDPGESGTPANEPAGSARQAITFGSAVAGEASNTTTPQFDTTGWTDTADLTHCAICDASTAGTFNWYGALTSTINFTAGDILTVAAGAIKLRLYDNGPTPPGSIITTAGSNKWLDHSLNVTAWTPLSAPLVSLHTAAPASDANEMTGGGYAREAWGTSSQGTSGDFTTKTHTGQLTFSNITSTPLRSWGIYQGTDLVFIRDQGGDAPVTPGSTIQAAPSTLSVGVD